MIILQLTEEEAQVLKLLLVQVIANQVNTNAQGIVTNAQNCIHFMGRLEKSNAEPIKVSE